MNQWYEGLLHFQTREETIQDVYWCQTSPKAKHLRYIKTAEDLDRTFSHWGTGDFQVKITLGDYLCSEMAKRYLAWLEKYGYLLEKNPDKYVINILKETAKENDTATECLVKCPSCTAKA